jgi:fructokinase
MKAARTVTCIGELIVDFMSTQRGVALQEATSFQRCAGGAAANVAAGLAKLGVRSAFVGKVGQDVFGKFLVRELRDAGVSTQGIVLDPDHKTRLAFVTVGSSGEREFEFWEKRPADVQLTWPDIDRAMIRGSAVVHVSSFLLIDEPSRSTAFAVANACVRSGRPVSFDPNFRPSLWPSKAAARRLLLKMVSLTSILRLNAEEAYFLTRRRTDEAAARALRALGPSLVVITRGADGCYMQSGAAATFVEGFSVRAVDTTGCGDAFLAGLLSTLARTETNVGQMNEEELQSMGRFANAVGALTATKRGAIPALPALAEVHKFLKGHA